MTLYERSHAALKDWQDIVEYTLDRHGAAQTEKYTTGLIRCIEVMAQDQVISRILKLTAGRFELSIVKNTTSSV